MSKFTAILLLLLAGAPVFASEQVITVTPVEKITTSSDKFQEGDIVTFKVIKSSSEKIKNGETVSGFVTYYEPNGFAGKEAIVHIEQFTAGSGTKLNGMIYAKGNQHNQIMEFKETIGIPAMWTRGGEVNFIPEKDVFLLYTEK